MSFLGRLGLSSVFSVESNHGSIVEQNDVPLISVIDFSLTPVDGALESPVNKTTQKRFNILDLGFKDNGSEYPKSLDLSGASLTPEMFVIFPGYTMWLSKDEDNDVLLQLFSDTDKLKPVSMIWAMYHFGMVYDGRIEILEDHAVFGPGTYLCKPELEKYETEFNLLA